MNLTAVIPYTVRTPTYSFTVEKAMQARDFHKTINGYHPTPLVGLPSLAGMLGIGGLYVKDESKRFSLNSFKGLGGSYAMHCLADNRKSRTFVTATDGNHGRGVAWAAKMLGQKAVVYLPKGTSAERVTHIRKLGAVAELTDMPYDDCVRFAAGQAKENNWILIQDTAWDGYTEIPALIMQGYTTMGIEICEQLGYVRPTHIFLQAGVGAMAGAMTGFFMSCYGRHKPVITIVEPDGADCIFRSVRAADGKRHFCTDLHTVMAGLSCGEPCTIGYEILEQYADFALSCEDFIAADGMRILGNPLDGDTRIISGESGAVCVGAVAEILTRQPQMKQTLGLSADSVVLCISTEGDTDRDNYRNIVWHGAYSR